MPGLKALQPYLDVLLEVLGSIPIGSMYGLFTYIYHKVQPNGGKYTKHGSYGIVRINGSYFAYLYMNGVLGL